MIPALAGVAPVAALPFLWLRLSQPARLRGEGAVIRIHRTYIIFCAIERCWAGERFAFITIFTVNSPDESIVFAVKLDMSVHRSAAVLVIYSDAKGEK